MRLAAITVVFAAFTGWSFWTISDDGLSGLNALLTGPEDWARQVFVDLAISLTVAWTFMRSDARARGLPFVPYVLGTLALGSISVLAYLVHRELRAGARPIGHGHGHGHGHVGA